MVSRRALLGCFSISVLLVFYLPAALAQENPYFVAYDHYLEEPGNLEIEYFSTLGTQRGGNNFHAFWTAPPLGGPRSCTWMARPVSTTARCLPASAGRIASGR